MGHEQLAARRHADGSLAYEMRWREHVAKHRDSAWMHAHMYAQPMYSWPAMTVLREGLDERSVTAASPSG